MAKNPLDVLMGLQVIRSRQVHELNGLVALAKRLLQGSAALRKRALAEIEVADQGLKGNLTLEVARSLYRTGIASLPELSRYRRFLVEAADGGPSSASQPVWVTLPEHCVGGLEGSVETLQAAAPRGLNIQGVCLEPDPPLSPIELFARLGFGYMKHGVVRDFIKNHVMLAFNGSERDALLTIFRAAYSEGADSGGAYSGFLTATYPEVYEEAFRRTSSSSDDDLPF